MTKVKQTSDDSATTPSPKKNSDKKFSFKKILTPFSAAARYISGSWAELKQVRWPDRKSTWGLTLAVIMYSGFFVGLIVLLDIGFTELFNLIIK